MSQKVSKQKETIVFILLSITASALNYLIYPLLSRILPPNEYINITVSLSLFTQISMFLSSIVAVTISLSKFGDEKSAHVRVSELQTIILKVFLLLAIGFLATSPYLMHWAHTPLVFAIPIVVMMLFSIPVTIVSGYMNGRGFIMKLGTITLISALTQFGFAASSAAIFDSGLTTIIAMTIAQLCSILIIYTLFRSDQLPMISLRDILRSSLRSTESIRLVRFTIASGLAVMLIGIVQLLDLVTAQRLVSANIKQYTDLYVLGRVVFFAGMILVVPFLGAIDVRVLQKNIVPLVRISVMFLLILLLMTVGIYQAGEPLTRLLFGTSYATEIVGPIIFMSMLFKTILLITTVCVLYLIVIRNQTAVWLSLATSITLLITSQSIPATASLEYMLVTLNAVAAIVAIFGFAYVVTTSLRARAIE